MHTPRKHGGCPLGPIDQERRELRWIFSNNCGSRDTRISNRRPIPYALDTDWPVVDAVRLEPVLAVKFPSIREKNRESCKFRGSSTICLPKIANVPDG
jgi:hypothetical protein